MTWLCNDTSGMALANCDEVSSLGADMAGHGAMVSGPFGPSLFCTRLRGHSTFNRIIPSLIAVDRCSLHILDGSCR